MFEERQQLALLSQKNMLLALLHQANPLLQNFNTFNMRSLLYSLGFLLAFTGTRAQNLIPNPGFDINVGCPTQIGQIDKADGWSVWGGTPDYFHSCANPTHPIFGTPFNNRGHRTPRSGDAYVGLFTHTIFAANGREFIGRPLVSPLIPGTTYYVSLYVCQADVAELGHTTNNIGVRFSTVPFSLVNPDTALNNAHVWSSVVINDSVNWVRISGSFVADSAYTHIGIGNYFSDSATTIVPGTSLSNYAYYLIDDVCVSESGDDCGFTGTGLNSFEALIGKLYPNPGKGPVFIYLNQPFRGRIAVYDLSGKMVLSKDVEAAKGETISLELPARGIMTLVANGISKRVLVH